MKKLLNKGFTIVELVIVIAVIGILAAVLIPTFSNVIESANETADLHEAQSTLKAYTSYMTSKGTPLSDGAVFKIEKTGRTYVFYKGALHQFDASSDENLVTNTSAPATYIGKGVYACNRFFTEFVENDQPGGTITFFYNDQKSVEFEDGSLKCKIYPGLVLELKDAYSATSDYKGKDDKVACSLVDKSFTNLAKTLENELSKATPAAINLPGVTSAKIQAYTTANAAVGDVVESVTTEGVVSITPVKQATATKYVFTVVISSKTYTFDYNV